MKNNNSRNAKPLQFASAFSLLLLLMRCALAADDSATTAKPFEKVQVEVFTAPHPVKTVMPTYPIDEMRRGREGWVYLNFMVGPDGKPYEMTVIESSGNAILERAALETAQAWRYEPAKRGDTAIHASQDLKLVFLMRDATRGAAKGFTAAYRSLQQAVDARDKVRADEELAKLDARNLYEDAYLNIARFTYHSKWGTEADQLADLRRAVAFERKPHYLPKDMFVSVLTQQLLLELKLHQFGSALKTWETLRPLSAKQDAESLQRKIDEVEALRKSDLAFSTAGDINKGRSWNGRLLKDQFSIRVTSGNVSEIRLRCEKQYLTFAYDSSLEYRIEGTAGSCTIEVIGTQGTTFELIES
ncbi:MAG: energy transducer TonB [Steroidobacteraceae bacterium]